MLFIKLQKGVPSMVVSSWSNGRIRLGRRRVSPTQAQASDSLHVLVTRRVLKLVLQVQVVSWRRLNGFSPDVTT